MIIFIIANRQLNLKNANVPVIKLWIMNLAVSDLFSLIFCIPFHLITEIFDNFVFEKNLLGEFACKIPPTIYYTSDWVSILTVFMMAVNRFTVFICPLKSSKLKNWKVNLFLIGFIWVISFLISLPNLVLLKLLSVCDLMETTQFYPTNHFDKYHIHWSDLGKVPCDENFSDFRL